MMTILLATEDGLAVAHKQDGTWQTHVTLRNHDCQAVAFDPHRPGRAYCGTFDAGLWMSEDAGETWQPVFGQLPEAAVMSVAVSPLRQMNGYGLLWAGTEPSRLFFSEDGGESWQEREGLQSIPSKPSWSFPPRPWTHHTRWIEPDANDPNLLYVGIELGGVMRSPDQGLHWEDRKPNSQHDCHTLATHSAAPGVIYEAAGGGFAMSTDGGQSWQRPTEGMRHHYVYGLAVDSGDPHTVIVSASYGARGAHSNGPQAESYLYRREGNGDWEIIQEGLPAPQGTRVYILAANPTQPGHFYAATGSRLFHSNDAGRSWHSLDLTWPDDFHSRGANGLVVSAH